MVETIVVFLAILLSGLAAGIYFYQLMGGTPAYKSVSAGTFIEFHKSLDKYMSKRMPPFFLAGLVTSILWLALEWHRYNSLYFSLIALAVILLVVGIVATIKGNAGINTQIQTWNPEQYPDNWAVYRDKWLAYFNVRIVTGILSFICLLLANFLK